MCDNGTNANMKMKWLFYCLSSGSGHNLGRDILGVICLLGGSIHENFENMISRWRLFQKVHQIGQLFGGVWGSRSLGDRVVTTPIFPTKI